MPSALAQATTVATTAAGSTLWDGLATGDLKPDPTVGRLTVAAFPALDEIIRAALPTWQRKFPNVELRIISRQFVDHHTAMTTALATASHLPDLIALEFGFVAKFAGSGALQDLRQPPFDATRFQDRWVPFAYRQGHGRQGVLAAIPADIGPGALFYRIDLLEKSGLVEADLTRSWDSYLAAGQALKARSGAFLLAHARELKDIVLRAQLQPGEGLYLDRDGRCLVNTPRFSRAFELAQQARKARLDAKVLAWTNEWTEGFRRGTVATQMSGAWLAGHLANWMAPATKGLWRSASLPEGSAAAWGGSFYAIPRAIDPAQKHLAWALIQLLTLQPDAQQRAFRQHDAFPSLLAAQADPFFEQPIAFLGGQKARLQWRDAAQRIRAAEVHRLDAIADEIVNTELDKVLDRGKDVASALGDAFDLIDRRARRR